MSQLLDQICCFLKEEGFGCSLSTRNGLDLISAHIPACGKERLIVPLQISATNQDEARKHATQVQECIRQMTACNGGYPLIITEDRWNDQTEMTKARILSHLEVFSPIYARNCEVRKIDKAAAKEFLEKSHSYGHAACRYCYGLFFKRHTGHIAKEGSMNDIAVCELMAVATFSNARKWVKGDQIIRSYEWTRYASLPHVRLSGGMGRLLKAFIKEAKPDDIMSYADLEWSEGDVYSQLGFELEGQKDPVMFEVDSHWKRTPIRPDAEDTAAAPKQEQNDPLYFQNFGSNKYRLKLTDYE